MRYSSAWFQRSATKTSRSSIGYWLACARAKCSQSSISHWTRTWGHSAVLPTSAHTPSRRTPYTSSTCGAHWVRIISIIFPRAPPSIGMHSWM